MTVDRGDEACRATGNIVFPTRFWMLHVWLFRPGPDGVFSESNSTVKAAEVLVDGQAR